MAGYVTKILTDVPHFAADKLATVGDIGTLVVLACSKKLSSLRTSTGLTVLRGKPYVAAAELLSAMVAKLSGVEETGDTSIVPPLLAKTLLVASECLSTTSTPRHATPTGVVNSSSSEGNTTVRDQLYLMISILSRSPHVTSTHSWLFNAGRTASEPPSISIETASLLFGCLANEEEALRPRAVAALDALLAAYHRTFLRDDNTYTGEETLQEIAPNPWSTAIPPVSPKSSKSESSTQRQELGRSLVPLIWNASQQSQPKQSRLAAARWSSDILMAIDSTNACHLLCFLSGDSDVTAASIAKDGLGLDSVQRLDSVVDRSKLPSFVELTKVLFSQTNGSSVSSWRPNFWDFSPKGKATAVQYLLKCLLNDLYSDDDDAVRSYMSAITKSLADIAPLGREYTELLDECAISLSVCLSTSKHARTLVYLKQLSLGHEEIAKLALTVRSSRARRHLAESCGHIFDDAELWKSDGWIGAVLRSLESCAAIADESASASGNVHGAAFLGGTCVRVMRLNSNLAMSDDGWKLASR
jgi:proteasome component ECM29